MKQGYIMIGVPGSGKSTYIKKIIADSQIDGRSVSAFSLDTCRLAFNDPDWASKPPTADAYSKAFDNACVNSKGFDMFVDRVWKDSLEADVVIVDNTNLTRKARARWVQDLRSKKFSIAAVNVMVPLDVAIARQKTRGDKIVPESVVRDMYMRQQEILVPAEADSIIHVRGF